MLLSIVYMDGDEAKEVIDALVCVMGPQEGITYLSQWDFGDETEKAGVYNGGYFERVDFGYGRSYTEGDYTIAWDEARSWVHLFRTVSGEEMDRVRERVRV